MALSLGSLKQQTFTLKSESTVSRIVYVSLSFSLSGEKNKPHSLSLLHLTSDIQPRTLNLSLPHTRLTETGVSCVETPV